MTPPSAAGGTDTLPFAPFELCPGVFGLFTRRAGGVSVGAYQGLNLGLSVGDDDLAVAANRDRLLHAMRPAPTSLTWMRQVHGADVTRVTRPAESAAVPAADASLTGVPGLALGALVADCAPVLLADPVARLVGVAHAGREGMAAGVVPALVAAMRQNGADPTRMVAAIGPAICGLCYEVPAELRDRVAALVPGSGCVTRAGTAGLDLRAGLHGQLACLGIAESGGDERCTMESPEFYSYRRDGRTGRFAGLAWLAA